MKYINRNAELYLALEDKDFLRRWKPISRQEMYIYLAVVIYIGLYTESSIKDYWHKDFSYGLMYIL